MKVQSKTNGITNNNNYLSHLFVSDYIYNWWYTNNIIIFNTRYLKH